MIRDQDIIAALSRLADLEGTTKAEALHRALSAFANEIGAVEADPSLFPRDRIRYRTYSI